jgi:hypothetical protein
MITDRNPLQSEGYLSTIITAAGWVTSAVTPAPLDQAATAGQIIECQNTPHKGCGDTQSWTP